MMRFLGMLFLLVLLVGGLGFCRGWFSVAASETGVTLSLDKDKVKSDTVKATEALGDLSRQAADQIRQLARRIGDDESVLEGRLIGVDGEREVILLEVQGETVELPLQEAGRLLLDGREVGLGELAVGDAVRVEMRSDGEALRIERVRVTRGG